MSFLNAAAFAFAAAIPVVVVLYLLKRKRTYQAVSSTILWQRFLAETQASAPFQKLRYHWLLAIQILLLILAVLALSRPALSKGGASAPLRVVVLDGSASMQATDESPSRFEKARAQALEMAASLRGAERMMILLAGVRAEVLQSPTSDKAALRRALLGCQPSDTPTRLADALKTAAAFTFERRRQTDASGASVEAEEAFGEIHLFSDGAASGLEEFETRALPLVWHRVGQRCENLGVVSLEARPHPDDPARRAVFVGIRNPGSNEMQAAVELSFENQPLETKPVSVPPGTTVPLVFFAAQSRDGVFTARLNTPDDLAADNQASVSSRLPTPARVLLVTRGNRFLERSLRGTGRVTLETAPALTSSSAPHDIVILDDITPAVWPDGNILAVHVMNTNWFEPAGRVEAPAVVDWRASHPLLRFVSMDNVAISETLGVKLPAWGQALVESPQTPLVVAGEYNRRRVVWIGFDLLQSTWPLRFSFPIFVANAVDWLNPASPDASPLTLHAGETFRWPVAPGVSEAFVTRPDGSRATLLPEPNAREVVWADTGRQGIYQLSAGTNSVRFTVNLTDAAETDITPRRELSLGKAGGLAATAAGHGGRELWRWLAAAALGALLWEWWFYQRRSV